MRKIKNLQKWFIKHINWEDLNESLDDITADWFDDISNPMKRYGYGYSVSLTQQYNEQLDEQEIKIIIRRDDTYKVKK